MKQILYTVFMLWCFFTTAQTQLFTVNDGLSNKNITAILQSRNGFLWVGTANGLNRYDGYSFYEYNQDNGLSGGKIKCLYEDAQGLLWIGTWEGLNILDQKTGLIKKMFQNRNNGHSVFNTQITGIEGAANGEVIVSTANGDIIRFRPGKSFETIYTLPKYDAAYKTWADAIKALPDASLLILSNYNVLQKITPGFKQDTAFADIKNVLGAYVSDHATTLTVTDLWGRISIRSLKNGRILRSDTTLRLNQAGEMPTQVVATGKGLYTGYSDGSLTFADPEIHKLVDYSAGTRPFNDAAITAIYPGKNNIIWIGSDYGLIKFCPAQHHFEKYLHVENTSYKNRPSIRGMIEDAKGDIYIGGYSGLFRLQHGTGTPKHFEFNEYGRARLNAWYPYRLLDDGDVIWVMSEAKGFYRFNKLTEKIDFPIPHPEFYKGFAILPLGADTLFLGTHHGLFIYCKSKNTLIKYCDEKDLFDVSATEIVELASDSKGNIWLGSYSSGLFKMKKGGGIVAHFSDINTVSSLNFVTALFLESDSVMWVGTRGNGLLRLNTHIGKKRFYTKKNGLADNSVAGIVRDNSGMLWISTFNGLSKFNTITATFENYYDRDGLTNNEFNTTACLKTRSGKIYVGGLNGINAFYPDALPRKRNRQTVIFLTGFAKYNGGSNRLDEKRLGLEDLKDIKLDHTDKFFTFSFSLDDYYNPQRNTFFYKLEGLENTWTNIGAQNTLRFNSLPAGAYTLKIKGISGEGNSSANEISVRITVSPAFYNTWWFYALVLLAAMALVFLITRYRIYQTLKIQKLRTKISSDLHDEVGSLLTRISIQAELIKQGISQSSTLDEVGRIADTSRQATAAMSDVLWSIDARNDKAGNLIDRLREHAGEVLFPLEIEVNFTVRNMDTTREIGIAIRQNLFLIFKEAINNIARHAGATQVNILLENKANRFVMIIADNGAGNKKTGSLKRGQGLRNMHMRAERLEGVLEADTSNGYTITLTIKRFS